MERRTIEIHGIVQSVGFRPYVHRLATDLRLGGFVQNQAGSLLIEIEGRSDALDRFCSEVQERPPPLARIEKFSWSPRPIRGERRFEIRPSDGGASQIFISPDVAVCRDCLAELFDPSNRRYRYPFINCTNCGPRLTIVTGAPYDRASTTMASFAMCSQCRAEYTDPRNRRFHAEPIACPDCGPCLMLCKADGVPVKVADPLVAFVRELRDGKFGALKGLGGYHLVCDACNEDSVAELRRRKRRDEKPFAIMVVDLLEASRLCQIGALERELLLSPSAPIVLLKRREPPNEVAQAVAPGNPYLGVMLPYTPLHHLVLKAVGAPLVMTSGNQSDEPIAFHDADAFQRLKGIADWFLTHNRPIQVRCEDSVTRVVSSAEAPIRRSRGVCPQPIHLPCPCSAPILAVGAHAKGTFALGRGREAFLSHHLGNLDQIAAYRALSKDIALYENLFGIAPASIAHDLHPDYASTRYAESRNLPRLPIQHHHAHLASCMVEHGLCDDVIGVIFDGAGLGTDGAIWGGEFLVGNYLQVRRMAHLRYVGMPGGERVVREPWRMAVAHLLDAGADSPVFNALASPTALRTLAKMLERGCNAPLTSSMGRLFDAVAAIAGVRAENSYEGQAAIELEWLAETSAAADSYPWELVETSSPDTFGDGQRSPCWIVDPRPLIRALVADVGRGTPVRLLARRFHTSVVELILDVCGRIRDVTGLTEVVLSGGVFMNALLISEARDCLSAAGFSVYCHHRVPANDGGLSLGQLAIAARCLATSTST